MTELEYLRRAEESREKLYRAAFMTLGSTSPLRRLLGEPGGRGGSICDRGKRHANLRPGLREHSHPAGAGRRRGLLPQPFRGGAPLLRTVRGQEPDRERRHRDAGDGDRRPAAACRLLPHRPCHRDQHHLQFAGRGHSGLLHHQPLQRRSPALLHGAPPGRRPARDVHALPGTAGQRRRKPAHPSGWHL